jgi:uncharacterized protein YutE (UPF0331/DUF86 family)
MDDLSKRILAEKENVEKALANLDKALKRKKKSVIELAAIGTFLHNIYNGIENILNQILKEKNIKVSKSESWHKDLLNLSVTNKIISLTLSDELYEYLTFRHFFVHAYGFMLVEDQLKDLAENISRIWSEFVLEIQNYITTAKNNELQES